jgi:integrase/recombinase XerD
MMDYLQDFLDFTQYVRGRSANTVQSYRYDLSQFLEWVKDKQLDPLKIRPVDIDEFFIWLRKERKNVAASIKRKRSGLIGLYRWFQRKELIIKNPMEYVSLMKEPKSLPNYLTPQQQEALILAAKDGTKGKRIGSYSRERTYLLILLLLDCGLRIFEACNLKVEDINFEDGTLKVNGKGEKERMAILSDRLLSALKEYLKRASVIDLEGKIRPGIPARGLKLAQIAEESGIPFKEVIEITIARRPTSVGGKREKQLQAFINDKVRPLPLQYVLFNRGGKSLNTRQAFRIIRDIGIRAGIKNLYPHLLRHTFAVNLRRKGGDTMLLKEALGHSSILTTQIYCGFTNGEFKEKMRQLVN